VRVWWDFPTPKTRVARRRIERALAAPTKPTMEAGPR
jgi:hypothetical protein